MVSSAEQRAAFFVVLARLGSVTLAAGELGLNRNTCFGWARRAGISSNGSPGPGGVHRGKEQYLRLRAAGTYRAAAARAAGVNVRTARDWDAGVCKSNGARIYPGGRRVDYTRGVTTPVQVPALERVLDRRFLSLADREAIRDMRAEGTSLRVIGAVLGRPASTVGRELARNSDQDGRYRPHGAHRAAAARRPRPKTSSCPWTVRCAGSSRTGCLDAGHPSRSATL